MQPEDVIHPVQTDRGIIGRHPRGQCADVLELFNNNPFAHTFIIQFVVVSDAFESVLRA